MTAPTGIRGSISLWNRHEHFQAVNAAFDDPNPVPVTPRMPVRMMMRSR
jgi:hypothetical protein